MSTPPNAVRRFFDYETWTERHQLWWWVFVQVSVLAIGFNLWIDGASLYGVIALVCYASAHIANEIRSHWHASRETVLTFTGATMADVNDQCCDALIASGRPTVTMNVYGWGDQWVGKVRYE